MATDDPLTGSFALVSAAWRTVLSHCRGESSLRFRDSRDCGERMKIHG
jgi:hypothetical protein